MARRCFVELVSNTAVLPPLDSLSVEKILNRQFPIDTILTFLHEVTHHWCFNTPVGITQSLLYATAIEKMFYSAQNENAALECRDTFARFYILDELLAPLYEGLALFAEQNVSSLKSKAASDPIILTGMHFGIDFSPSFFSDVSEVLTRCRRTISNIKQKRDILSKAGDPAKSPYLAGYMSVLACFYRVASRNTLLRDPDFFMIYFRTFMFDDLEFAYRILQSDKSLESFSVDTHGYLRDRFHRFLTMDHDREADQLHELLQRSKIGLGCVHKSSDADQSEIIAPDYVTIANNPALAERGRTIINRRIQELSSSYTAKGNWAQGVSDSDLSKHIRYLLANVVSTRSTLRLVSRKVWIVNFENGVGLAETEADYLSLIAKKGGNIIPLPIESNVPNGPALLECLANRAAPYFVLRALDESEPSHVIITFGHGRLEVPQNILGWSHSKTQKLAALGDDILKIGKDGRHALEIEQMARTREESRLRLREVYQESMMFHHALDEPLTTEFLENGFNGVLQDRELVKALAALSILGFIAVPDEFQLISQRGGWEWLVSVGELKIDYDEAVAALAERGSAAGWNLVVRMDSHIAGVLPC